MGLDSAASRGGRRLGPVPGGAVGAGAGLVIDFGLFSVLAVCGAAAFSANLVSSTAATVAVFALMTRSGVPTPLTWRTRLAFVAWYAYSALVVSEAIGVIGAGMERTALIAKVCIVPLALITNHLVARWLLAGGAERLLRRRRIRPVRRRGPKPARRRRPGEPALAAFLRRRRPARLRIGVAAVLTALFGVAVLPHTIAASLTQPADRPDAVLPAVLHGAFLVGLFAALVLVIRLAQAARFRSVRHRRWLAVSAAYLLVNLVVLGLIYPGFWVWDEFFTLDQVRVYSTQAWQGYFTTVFYTFGLLLGGSPIAILLLQLVLIALVVGYAVSLLMHRLRRPALAALAVLPLLSFPVLLNNQYPLRLTLYAYLLLLLVVRLGLLRSARARGEGALRGFIEVSALIALLAFWRSEGMILLLLAPVAFVLAGLHREIVGARRRRVIAASVLGTSLIAAAGALTAATSQPGYQATAVINPLSTMLQGPLASPHLSEDLHDIDRVVDLRLVRSSPSWIETPSLWAGALRNGFDGSTGRLLPAFADLAVHNPGPFLDNRLRAFLAANSMQPGYLPVVQSKGVFRADFNVDQMRHAFEAKSGGVRELDPDVKYPVERRLLFWTDDRQLLPSAAIVWNVLPQLAAALLVGAVAASRRRWWWVLGSAIVLGNAAVVFLTEPAAYFMYFFPAYLLGCCLATAAVVHGLDAALSRVAARRRPALRIESSIVTLQTSAPVVPRGAGVNQGSAA